MSDRTGMDPRSARLDPRSERYFHVTRERQCAFDNDLERRATLAARADAEAWERVNRLRQARATGSVKRDMGVAHIAPAPRRFGRPCTYCGAAGDCRHRGEE